LFCLFCRNWKNWGKDEQLVQNEAWIKSEIKKKEKKANKKGQTEAQCLGPYPHPASSLFSLSWTRRSLA